MPAVRVLPDSLVNQIAAGEVVERPASVLKELVENALDAGARRVAIDVEGGGVARLAVSDDGCGMGPEDALLALSRHATSKIATLQDLAAIATLGFRGEALPSIASVSRLSLVTSPDDSGLGSEVVAERGGLPVRRPARHPKGTRVTVEDLFGNVPARRKFLKSPGAELRALLKTATALALARPDVGFVLRDGARTLLDLPPAADAPARFEELLGESAGKARGISARGPGIELSGAVSPAGVSFASRSHQWLFVNGRSVRDATIAHAVTLAAREALLTDRHPAFALFLSCDPALCDVNVHPQKLEVRFRDPASVHSLVHRALAAALTGAKGATPLDAGRLVALDAGGGGGTWAGRGGYGGAAVSVLAEAIGVYGGSNALLAASPAPVALAAYAEAPLAVSAVGPLRLLGQYRASFLLAEGEPGLVLVDQHAAHERVRYERLRARLRTESVPAQRLLLPVAFEATASEAALFPRAEPLLATAGFAVSELSGNTFLVSSTPADCPAGAVVPFLRDFLGALADIPEGGERAAFRARDALAASLACRGAVTVNTPLAAPEAARILADLAACEDPFTCAHGRPAILSLAHGELLKRFGRR